MLRIKLNKPLNEMALGTYKTIGNFEKQGPFRGIDRKMVTHPGYLRKLTKFFSRTPITFNLWMSNVPGLQLKHGETGVVTKQYLKEIFPKKNHQEIDQMFAESGGAITVIFLGNYGAEKVMMTPWIVAHRIGHAFAAESRRSSRLDTWSAMNENFMYEVDQILKDHYRYDIYDNRLASRYGLNRENRQIYTNLFQELGTQKSSRDKKLRRPGEFAYECFAQFIATGNVKFNPLPKSISMTTRKAFGRSIEPRMARLHDEDREELSQNLSTILVGWFETILKNNVGKVYLM